MKVADGALPDSTIMGRSDGRSLARNVLRTIAIVSGVLVLLLVLVGLGVMVLSKTSAFAITEVQTYDSEHVSADEVARLASIPEGLTLLSVDEEAVSSSVQKNPWVASVDVERIFPSTLRLKVHERKAGALVAMGSGSVVWLMGTDGVWIEPYPVEVSDKESANDAALDQASLLGVILISDVPVSVSPKGGFETTDSSIEAVRSFQEQLSPEFRDQIAGFSAPNEDDISCLLHSGVEISLGPPLNVDVKESVAKRILDEFGGQVTYINVRVPSHPTYRRVNSTFVREGSGAVGEDEDEEDSALPKIRAREKDDEDTSEEEDETSTKNRNADDQGESSAYSAYDKQELEYVSYDMYGEDEQEQDVSYGYDEL